ncbi:hypothetical protein F5X99DRAFT_802 [Biscogniauxia marginata]|nr:hypothetical protein F5X99DRAFT_802 [Biscogniauxia marginata]
MVRACHLPAFHRKRISTPVALDASNFRPPSGRRTTSSSERKTNKAAVCRSACLNRQYILHAILLAGVLRAFASRRFKFALACRSPTASADRRLTRSQSTTCAHRAIDEPNAQPLSTANDSQLQKQTILCARCMTLSGSGSGNGSFYRSNGWLVRGVGAARRAELTYRRGGGEKGNRSVETMYDDPEEIHNFNTCVTSPEWVDRCGKTPSAERAN